MCSSWWLLCFPYADTYPVQDSKPGNDLAISGVWQLSRLHRSLALMMLTWATRLQDPVLASQVGHVVFAGSDLAALWGLQAGWG